MTMPAKNESQKKRHSAASRSARSLTCGTRNGAGGGGKTLWIERVTGCGRGNGGGLQEGEYAALGAAGALVRQPGVVHAQGAFVRAQPMREVHA